MIQFDRSEQTILGHWFWTIDRILLLLIFSLFIIGLIAMVSAAPAAAYRYSGATHQIPDMFYFKRQLLWVAIGTPLMLVISMLSITTARRLALVTCGLFFLAMLVTPFIGHEVNGARRWIRIGSFLLQPSEFLKPAFVVTTAWIMSLRFKDSSLPCLSVSFLLYLIIAMLLVRQPDLGQTALIGAIWIIQATVAGMGLFISGTLILAAAAALGVAYLVFPHVNQRIEKYFTGAGDTYQIDQALACFRSGRWVGTGLGEGTAKYRLPEPHTDYIFSVIGEEYGAIVCLGITLIFLAIVVRVFTHLMDEEDPFILLAASGLVSWFGLQGIINIMVNLALLPSKGMTLPFISYGGSSFLACAFGMGLLLALTRRNPFLSASPFKRQSQGGEI